MNDNPRNMGRAVLEEARLLACLLVHSPRGPLSLEDGTMAWTETATYEQWTAFDPGRGMNIGRLVSTEVLKDTPAADFFEAHVTDLEKVGEVEMTATGNRASLVDCYREE